MNGASISWGAGALAFGFATLLVGIGKQHLIVLVIGIILLLFAVALTISKSSISFDTSNKTLVMQYRNLFRRRNMSYQIEKDDYLSFYHEKNNPDKIDFILLSTNWYPVKNSSYYVTLNSQEKGIIILSECVGLKETYALCKEFKTELSIDFRSPLKKRK